MLPTTRHRRQQRNTMNEWFPHLQKYFCAIFFKFTKSIFTKEITSFKLVLVAKVYELVSFFLSFIIDPQGSLLLANYSIALFYCRGAQHTGQM